MSAAAWTVRNSEGQLIPGLMAGSRLGPAEVTSASVGLLGFLLANVDLMLDGQIDAETAFRVTTGYAGANVAP